MQVKVQLYNEAERFASVYGKGPMVAIKEITLEPEDQYVTMSQQYPIEVCRELAAVELSKHIINRLGYRVESNYEGQPKYYTFHIATLVEAEKLKLKKEIRVLQEDKGTFDNKLSLIKAEAKRYKELYRAECSKSLWTIIKERLFK